MALHSLLPKLGFDTTELRRTADNRLYISGKLDGQRRSFLVDSGWSYTTVNRKAETNTLTVGEIKLGRVRFFNQPARQERVIMGERPAAFDVVLGLDFLRRHSAVLDCGAGRLFTRREPPTPETRQQFTSAMQRAGYIAIELRIREAAALVCPARLEGNSFELLVDTGAAWTCLDGSRAEKWGLKPQPSTTRLSGAAKVGTRGLAVAEVKSLRLGEVAIARTLVGLVELADWGLAQEGKALGEIKGLLGGEILAAHSAVIDCGELKLWLKPLARK